MNEFKGMLKIKSISGSPTGLMKIVQTDNLRRLAFRIYRTSRASITGIKNRFNSCGKTGQASSKAMVITVITR